mgnify:CR=1 FL=1
MKVKQCYKCDGIIEKPRSFPETYFKQIRAKEKPLYYCSWDCIRKPAEVKIILSID